LDRDANGKLILTFRFNKDISNGLDAQGKPKLSGNEGYFYVLDKNGKLVPSSVSIENNDAKITLSEPVGLVVGDAFK
ncbi:hypothetical protein L0M92_15155, partial [Casaltella massiliensis]|nr:hypothetical protein [Casaltella massiliensis]